MFKHIVFIIAAIFITSSNASSITINGFEFPDKIKAGKGELVLNGAGFRMKMGIKIYACALYVMNKTQDAIKIQDSEEPMAVRLTIIKLIRGEDWKRGWEQSFSKSGINTSYMHDKVKQFVSFFNDGSNEKDIYDILYLPEEGTVISKNDKLLGKIKGNDFKRLLFSIWIGEKAQSDLKAKLLNKPIPLQGTKNDDSSP
ncbi:MAG: chalcone isomerase family protein [Desulfobacterales bacterium]|nr:chalcone isomerase family protein [Desulfobacterales bacterium]MBF0397318.1 chalcone isomerase family protein [Desulfobacterales bacterium]